MTTRERTILDEQINRFGFWSAVVFIASLAISLFLPLDVPGVTGRNMPTESRGLMQIKVCSYSAGATRLWRC